jgi:hypothetical protein
MLLNDLPFKVELSKLGVSVEKVSPNRTMLSEQERRKMDKRMEIKV